MDVPNTFTPGTVIKSAEVNANFASLLPSTTGTAAATLGDYLDNIAMFNVKNVGGATGDGLTDDTAAIQATITAAAATGGIVYFPIGSYVVTSTLVVTGGVTLRGGGSGYGTVNTCILLWMGTGFCIKMGNTAGTLSYGMEVSNLRIALLTTNSGIWLYGAAHSAVRNVDIEGVQFTSASIGVQVDGADISSFFVALENVQCNHVFKGFVHTTTGSVQPTQVVGTNCSALCDNTAGSMGIEVQSVAGVGCGDGVTYVSGNVEACDRGISLNGGGTTILGMRFENSHGLAGDVYFDTLARCNQVFGGSAAYRITNVSGSPTNQVFGVPKDQSNVISQVNLLDATTVARSFTVGPNAAAGVGIYQNGTSWSGTNANQFGAAINPTIDSSAATAGHGVSIHPATAATAFVLPILYGLKIQPPTVGAGSSITTQYGVYVDNLAEATTNYAVYTGTGLVRFGGAFGCNGATPQPPLAGGAALAAYGAGANGFDTAGHAQEIHDKLNTILTALRANGILTT